MNKKFAFSVIAGFIFGVGFGCHVAVNFGVNSTLAYIIYGIGLIVWLISSFTIIDDVKCFIDEKEDIISQVNEFPEIEHK